jgi:hypothetical protein
VIVEEEKAINTFEKFKEILSNAPILRTPKWYELFWLHVDASNIAVGTTLS